MPKPKYVPARFDTPLCVKCKTRTITPMETKNWVKCYQCGGPNKVSDEDYAKAAKAERAWNRWEDQQEKIGPAGQAPRKKPVRRTPQPTLFEVK